VETLETLARRMGTAEALRDLVRTMKSLAAAGVRHHERALAALSAYEETIDLGLQALLRGAPRPPATARGKDEGAPGILVIGSDRGFCGGFNDQVVARVLEDLSAPGGAALGGRLLAGGPVAAVGGRVATRLREAGLAADVELALPTSSHGLPALVEELVLAIDAWGSPGRVVAYHNRPATAATCRPHRQPLLPFPVERRAELAARPWPTRMLPLQRADRAVLLRALLGQHLVVALHRALALSLAAEHLSRLVAMQAAERNVEERLADLRARYHALRQTSITTELLDIVSGAEAVASAAAGADADAVASAAATAGA
jgi:F-type H+-transporting ATPase subunit gamma